MQSNIQHDFDRLKSLLPMVTKINPSYPEAPGYKNESTSKAAAESIKPRTKKLEERVLDVIRSFPFGCSPERVCEELEENILSVRPRFSQLKAKGLIEDSGRRDRTLCGKQSIIWLAV